MVRAEPTNNRTASIETNPSTMFTLLLELNAICEQRWIQFRDEHGSGLDRTGSGLNQILAGSGLDRTAIFLKIGV